MLSQRECEVIDRHLQESGTQDGVRVLQWENASSVYFAGTGKLWVHNHAPRKQAKQELYFHSVHSVASTLTCAHPLKFWDLRRQATAREMARIQGFPDSFVLPRSRHARLFGNAVAVPCATHAVSRVVSTKEGPSEDPPSPLRHLDLCAGIGGFSLAVHANAPRGASVCVGYSEICPAAIKCYEDNFPNAPALGDARGVEVWPECDLLTAGFPCQPFSVSNTRARREGHKSRDFFRVVLDAVRQSKATRVVLENVASIVNTGAEQWTVLCDTLRDDLGFVLDHAVLCASEFGVPQKRRRMYLVGRRDGVAPLPLSDYVATTPPVRLWSIVEGDTTRRQEEESSSSVCGETFPRGR